MLQALKQMFGYVKIGIIGWNRRVIRLTDSASLFTPVHFYQRL